MVAQALQQQRHALLGALKVLPRADGIVEGCGLNERRSVALTRIVVVVQLPDLARNLADCPACQPGLRQLRAVPLLRAPQLVVLLRLSVASSGPITWYN